MILYLLIILHVVSSLLFLHAGIEYALLAPALVIIYNMYNFFKISVLVLSPAWEIELDHHEETPIREKMLLQCAGLLSLYLIYNQGYEAFAGAGLFVSVCFTGSFITTVLNSFSGEDD